MSAIELGVKTLLCVFEGKILIKYYQFSVSTKAILYVFVYVFN